MKEINQVLEIVHRFGNQTDLETLLKHYANQRYGILLDTDVFSLDKGCQGYKDFAKAETELAEILMNLLNAGLIDRDIGEFAEGDVRKKGLIRLTEKSVEQLKSIDKGTLKGAELFESMDASFFRDQLSRNFMRFLNRDHYENIFIESRQFKDLTTRILYERTGDIPSDETIRGVQSYANAQASFSQQTIPVEPRIVENDGSIFYDLGDNSWRAVKINADGWKVIESRDAPYFVRYNHMLPQVSPVDCGISSIDKIFDVVSIKDKEEQMLFKVDLVSSFLPNIPRPTMTFHGSQGAGKSISHKATRRIVDPSVAEVSGLPDSRKDFLVTMLHNYFPIFDNIRELKDSVSDALCRAITGEGITVRELYTNFDELAINFKRKVGLNGINLPTESPDLVDRTNQYELARISKEERKTEAELWENFAQSRPLILGACFSILSKALTIVKTLKMPKLPRMADFCLFGEAIAQAMGYEPLIFFNAYIRHVGAKNMDTLYANTVGLLVLKMLETGEFEGTPSDLFGKLKDMADKSNINTKNKEIFPQSPQALSRKMKDLEVNFLEEGVEVSWIKSGSRKIVIKNIVLSVQASKPLSEMAQNGSESIASTSVQASMDDIKTSAQISSLSESPTDAKNEENGQIDGNIDDFTKVLRKE